MWHIFYDSGNVAADTRLNSSPIKALTEGVDELKYVSGRSRFKQYLRVKIEVSPSVVVVPVHTPLFRQGRSGPAFPLPVGVCSGRVAVAEL